MFNCRALSSPKKENSVNYYQSPLVFLFLGENREILTVRKREDHKRERDNMRDEVLLSADPVEPEANSTSPCLRFHYKPISLHFKKKWRTRKNRFHMLVELTLFFFPCSVPGLTFE